MLTGFVADLRRRGGTLWLRSPSHPVRRLLAVTGLDRVIPYERDDPPTARRRW